MKFKKMFFIGVLALPALAACGDKTNSFYITFHQDEGDQSDSILVVQGTTTEEQVEEFQDQIELNERVGYDVYWDDYDFYAINTNYTVEALYELHDYTITYMYGSQVLGTTIYTIESTDVEIMLQEPDLPSETGYSFRYEDYTVVGKHEDFVVEAIKSVDIYKITYVYETTVLGTTEYTVESSDDEIKLQEPALPTKTGYRFEYEDYTIVGKHENFTVNALAIAETYYATFVDEEGIPVADPVPFTVETTKLAEPPVPTKEHYSGAWQEYVIKAEDMTIYPVYTPVVYYATFIMGDGQDDVVEEFTIENSTIHTPIIEIGDHVLSADWLCNDVHYDADTTINLADSLEDKTFVKFTVGEKHTLTFNANGGICNVESMVVEYGKSYELPAANFKDGTAKLYGWFDSVTGEEIPEIGVSKYTSDKTLIARYYSDFETSEEMEVIINGSRNTIENKSLDTVDKTCGDSSVKILTKASDTFSCSFDSDFLTSCFADPNVVAINFDCKVSEGKHCTKFSYGNRVDCPYEKDCCAADSAGFGAQPYWKTFSLTREKYNNRPSGQNCLVCTVGNQLPAGSYIWFDNIHPVSEPLTYWGFENSRLVEYQPESTWYNHTVSYRDFADKEIFTVNYAGSITDDSPFGFDYDIKSEGNRSIKAHKLSNKNVWTYVMNSGDIASIQFDVYVTTELNTRVTFLKGNMTPMSDVNLKANTWTTYLVDAEDMTVSGTTFNFLYLTGSPEYDIYFDNLVITLK